MARGTSGPFTTTKFVVVGDVATVRGAPGVRAELSPMISGRATIGSDSLKDVNLVGFEPDGVGAPEITEGRSPRKPGEIAVHSHLDADVGDRVLISGRPERVVGKTADLRYNFGVNTVFLTIKDADSLAFARACLS